MTRIGSLFSGYGGLDVAVQSVLGGEVAWHAEIDPAASRVLAARFPNAANLGDITAIGWRPEHAVDVLTGGFPCQDISAAGQRGGMGEGTRSGLWAAMADAVHQLRPALVVVENVRALLTGGDECDDCDACQPPAVCPARSRMLDNGSRRPVYRTWMGAVLGDLARIGYDAAWCCVRASDVGAPHRRARVFVAAWPSPDAERDGRRGRAPAGTGGADEPGPGPRAATARRGADPAPDSGGPRRQGPGRAGGTAGRGAPQRTAGATPEAGPLTAPDPEGHGRDEGRPGAVRLLGGPHAPVGGGGAVADPASGGREGRTEHDVGPDESGRPENPHGHDADRLGVAVDWGAYAAAVHRWETVSGRRAPVPTITGARGQPKLNPAFVEWLMGLPPGWVTAVPGITANDMLRILGNGVVPAQAAAALRWLLDRRAEAEAS